MKTVSIIGAGHNGLVASLYLARAGFKVSIFEARRVVGGMCVTEELLPGYKISTLANWYGMLRPEIIADFNLEFKTHLPKMKELVLFSDGTFSCEGALAQDSNLQTILHTNNAITRMLEELFEISKLLRPLLLQKPLSQEEFVLLLHNKGFNEIADCIFSQSWFDFAQSKIETTDVTSKSRLLELLCTYSFGSPFAVGSIYGVILSMTARTNGVDGSWGFIEGGMGEITKQLAIKAQELGVQVHVGSPVTRIVSEKNKVVGIELQSGEHISSDIVISNADPHTTYRLLPEHSNKTKNLSITSAGVKMHLIVNEFPQFAIDSGVALQKSLGSVAIVPSLEDMKKAIVDSNNGVIPDKNLLVFYIPTMYDAHVAPEGKHVISLYCSFVPCKVNGSDWSRNDELNLYSNVLHQLQQYIPNIEKITEEKIILSPSTIEHEYGAYNGNPWHIDGSADQLLKKRGINCKGYKTPLKGLYLCGAGTHPGGTVSGACGHNCAKEIIEDEN